MKLKEVSLEYEIKVGSRFDERLALLNESLADEFDVHEPMGFHDKNNVVAQGVVEGRDYGFTCQINISATGKVCVSSKNKFGDAEIDELEELEALITQALEQNLEIELFARGLGKLNDKEVTTHPIHNSCSHKNLVEGHFYIGNIFKKNELKEKIIDFAKQNKFKFVATTDCQEHYSVNPLATKAYTNDHPHIFVEHLPENITGTTVYFFTGKNFQKYKQLAKTGGPKNISGIGGSGI